ncbi:helix-turn-helix domain-containing protein [Compostimonas suwonensis]|uniref:Regulatory LuxR family protein n=1 Tax=Compostimonas suwonensis TaxID=1048394 RepID=A0A2M9BWU1_9MICO|nr:helix-turn-helix transcriptional regulator [Compostimonas suwonensis]PJJ62426.1 regulatory LuxR family protein [Compostimonas suwonensis]
MEAALQRAEAAQDVALRAEFTTRAVRIAYRARQLHRLIGHEALLLELKGPVLDLVDVSRAVVAGDIGGAITVLRLAATHTDNSVWVAAVAGDVLIAAITLGLWRDAAEVLGLIRALVSQAGSDAASDPELAEIVRRVEFDALGAAALIEHHTAPTSPTAPAALEALARALERPRIRHLLSHEHGFALLAFGSVLNGRRDLGGSAVALARAARLIDADREMLLQWARAELALVRVRQARWEDARRLADELDHDAGTEESPAARRSVAAAVRAVLAALDGRFAHAERFSIRALDGTGDRGAVITSVLLTHARIASAIGRNDWAALLYALDDLEQQNHRHIFDQHEWHALRAMALWHLDRLTEYRALYASWNTIPGADGHAYRWAHAAIIARIDGDTVTALDCTREAVDALTDDYDPLGRTWVRILAGTHVSLLGDPVRGLSHYEDARTELIALGANGFAALCTNIIRTTSNELARRRQDDPLAALTTQQRDIAGLVAAGYTSTEIGELLHLSRKTIDFHVANILVRLGIRTRREISRVIKPAAPTGPEGSLVSNGPNSS